MVTFFLKRCAFKCTNPHYWLWNLLGQTYSRRLKLIWRRLWQTKGFIADFKSKHEKDIHENKMYDCSLLLLVNMYNVIKQNQVKIDIDSLQERVELHTLIICASLKNWMLTSGILDSVEKAIHYVKLDKTEMYVLIVMSDYTHISSIQTLLQDFFKAKQLTGTSIPTELLFMIHLPRQWSYLGTNLRMFKVYCSWISLLFPLILKPLVAS